MTLLDALGYYSNFRICKQIYSLRSYENREVLAYLKTDSNKKLACSHFFNVSFNTTNFRRTATAYKILTDFFYLLI